MLKGGRKSTMNRGSEVEGCGKGLSKGVLIRVGEEGKV